MKRLGLIFAVIVGLLSLAWVSHASPLAFSLDWWTVDGGGATFSSGDSYRLGGASGQPDAGAALSGSNYRLAGGFWSSGEAEGTPLPPPPSATPPTPTATATPASGYALYLPVAFRAGP